MQKFIKPDKSLFLLITLAIFLTACDQGQDRKFSTSLKLVFEANTINNQPMQLEFSPTGKNLLVAYKGEVQILKECSGKSYNCINRIKLQNNAKAADMKFISPEIFLALSNNKVIKYNINGTLIKTFKITDNKKDMFGINSKIILDPINKDIIYISNYKALYSLNLSNNKVSVIANMKIDDFAYQNNYFYIIRTLKDDSQQLVLLSKLGNILDVKNNITFPSKLLSFNNSVYMVSGNKIISISLNANRNKLLQKIELIKFPKSYQAQDETDKLAFRNALRFKNDQIILSFYSDKKKDNLNIKSITFFLLDIKALKALELQRIMNADSFFISVVQNKVAISIIPLTMDFNPTFCIYTIIVSDHLKQ